MTTEDLIWAEVSKTIFCSREAYFAALSDWIVARQTSLIRMSKGPEFHFIMIPGSHLTKQDIRDCVQPIIDQFGYATTRTPKQDTRQHRFNRLIGFIKTGEDDFDIHYRIDALRHV